MSRIQREFSCFRVSGIFFAIWGPSLARSASGLGLSVVMFLFMDAITMLLVAAHTKYKAGARKLTKIITD